MQIIHDPLQFQRLALGWRAGGDTHALVPTMGALHQGHYTLVEHARRHGHYVSVSVFVNPIQFGAGEDLGKYPRSFEADAEGCRRLGVDVLFAPAPDAMYPDGFQTQVAVERMGLPLCGASRPGHFQGVTTVVLKLLMLAQPTVALFGWKDAQQFLVLRRMVKDLAVPVELAGVETVREPDGLAMSSRNAYLSPEERAAAPAIHQGLCAAREAFARGEAGAARLIAIARRPIEACPLMALEYLEARSLETLDPLDQVQPGGTLLAAAVRLPSARLIDNIRL